MSAKFNYECVCEYIPKGVHVTLAQANGGSALLTVGSQNDGADAARFLRAMADKLDGPPKKPQPEERQQASMADPMSDPSTEIQR